MNIKVLYLALQACFIFATLQGQIYYDSLKNAEIVRLDSLSEAAYNLVRPFNLIIVGEAHGTKEPASLVQGLTKLFLEHGDSVQIGLELKEPEIESFLRSHDSSILYKTAFFSKAQHHPQASKAWGDLLLSVCGNRQVQLFSFDVVYTDRNMSFPRDSAMYLSVKAKMLRHNSWKTVILTGSTHASLLQVHNIPTLAYYLSVDTELRKKSRIVSVLHYYRQGELWDTSGDVPQQYEKWYDKLPLPNKQRFKSYLLLSPKTTNEASKMIFYTEKATRSKIIWNE